VLGEFEQLVLLAVMRRSESAYGIPIRDEIVRRARRDVALGGIYKTLARLEDKGFLSSTIGAPSARRGGRRTRCYTITGPGQRALRAALGSIQRMAAGLNVVPETR
jgi:PadR family transcriptional regulator, regulatory protein PadR